MKKLSCGTLIFSENKILLCKVTGSKYWDIPKGLNEVDESKIQTAIRELKEETGFIATEDELEDLGLFKYNSQKDLYLFRYIGNKTFDTSKAECTSYFVNRYTGDYQREVCDFGYFSKEEALEKSCKSLSKVLEKLI